MFTHNAQYPLLGTIVYVKGLFTKIDFLCTECALYTVLNIINQTCINVLTLYFYNNIK